MTCDDLPRCFRALPGYFKAFESNNARGIDSTVEDPIELIAHKSWKELYDSIPKDTDRYHHKLFILARHGQGFHNAAILRYGVEEWEKYWSLLNGDEHGSWLDSRLTALGRAQVQATGEQVLSSIVKGLLSFPHVFFSSPMRRCLETFAGSWAPNLIEYKGLAPDEIVPVNIVEDLRETLGVHTCDKRVSYSEVVDEYQNLKTTSGHTIEWKFERQYTENDEMWLSNHRETDPEMDQRVNRGLRKIFRNVTSSQKIVSLTCHSGVIKSTLRNLGHPPVEFLNTGGVVCLVVKLDMDQLT